MSRRPNSAGSAKNASTNRLSKYDQDFDDRIHNVHRRDDSDLINISRAFRRAIWKSKTLLTLIGFVITIYLLWPKSWTFSHRGTDWSKYAYVQYAVDEHHLCSTVMVFESLHRTGSKAQRVLMHHIEWSTTEEGGRDKIAELLSIAKNKYDVILKPVQVLDSRGQISKNTGLDGRPSTWDTSVTKLRAFELTEYDRVIVLDSDITLFKHVDELFHLPKVPIAMPGISLNTNSNLPRLSSSLVVLQPNPRVLTDMLDTLQSWRRNPNSKLDLNLTGSYATDLLNLRFGGAAHVLSPDPYLLSSAEFRREDHSFYLRSSQSLQFSQLSTSEQKTSEVWNPVSILKQAKIVLFDDFPLPKPWVDWTPAAVHEMQPSCRGQGNSENAALQNAAGLQHAAGLDGDIRLTSELDENRSLCREREIWIDLYEEFRSRREAICRSLPMEAPDWRSWKAFMETRRPQS